MLIILAVPLEREEQRLGKGTQEDKESITGGLKESNRESPVKIGLSTERTGNDGQLRKG